MPTEDQIYELTKQLRALGCAVCVFQPEEFTGVDADDLEEVMTVRGNEFISDNGGGPNDDDDEEELADDGTLATNVVTIRFTAQAWINDNAVETGEKAEYPVTLSEAAYAVKCIDKRLDVDFLQHARHAPQWVKDWAGPFEIYFEAYMPEDEDFRDVYADGYRVTVDNSSKEYPYNAFDPDDENFAITSSVVEAWQACVDRNQSQAV